MAPCDVKCSVCGRCFRRESEKARHKCTAELQKPVQEKEGAVVCLMCGRWLRSRGGLWSAKSVVDYPDERSIYVGRECDCGVQGVW